MREMLEFSNVSAKMKKFRIKDVSFTVPDGYVTGLTGKNGAGKTTIMRLILDLVKKSSGSITLDGMDSIRDGVALRNQVGFVMEDAGFLMGKSAVDNGRILGELYENWEEEKFFSCLEGFGFSKARRGTVLLGELSKGQYMRFQLAFALAHKPKLLLLDEPTANLDPVFRMKFLEELQSVIEQEETAVLFATHITSDLDKIMDYLVVLDEGRVCCTGDKETLFDYYGTNRVSEVILKSIRGEGGTHAEK